MASSKFQLSFSERLSQTLKMQVQLFVPCYAEPSKVDQIASQKTLSFIDPEKGQADLQVESKIIEKALYRDAESKEDYHQRCSGLTEIPDQEILSPPATTLEDSSQQSGQTIGPFINCTHHADGLFSTVYKDPLKRLAIKVTIPSQTRPPHDSKREARILAAAASTYIIPLLDTHTLSSQFLLVFPFQPLDLATVLRRASPLHAKAARLILQGLFLALAHIHSKGIIHRDVKPANILLSSPVGPAYLADFGIAWSPDDPASEPSDQKITDVGTTCYRPPELLFGHKAYGSEVDQWAAGCVVAECVRRGLHGLENPNVKVGEAEWTLFDAGAEGNELALIKSIFETLGTPSDETWPEAQTFPDWNKMSFHAFPPKSWREILPLASEEARDLVSGLVRYQCTSRLSAVEAGNHVFFSDGPASQE